MMIREAAVDDIKTKFHRKAGVNGFDRHFRFNIYQ